ncbi:MAG: hypothetical protein R3C01_06095 [Planctomycetaceae bacterium]
MLLLLGGVCLNFASGFLHGDDVSPPKNRVATSNDTGNSPSGEPGSPANAAALSEQHQQALGLLHDATNRMYGYSSLQASVHEVISLGARNTEAKGSYVAGEFPRLRLEYQIRVGNTEGTLIEVCDSQVLRTLREISSTPTPIATAPASDGTTPPAEASPATEAPKRKLKATRRDVHKMLDSVRKQGATADAVIQAQLGLGGIPALLASFERTMNFDTYDVRTVGNQQTVTIEGYWKPDFKKGLSEQFTAAGRDPNQFLPERVRVEIDLQTLVPTRIQYLRRTSGETPTLIPLLDLQFRDIRVNQPIDPKVFEISLPPEVQEVDLTEVFIKNIEAPAQVAP